MLEEGEASLNKREGFIEDYLVSGTIMSLDEKHVIIGWGKRHWATHYDPSVPCGFYFPDFFLESEAPWFFQEHVQIATIESMLALLSSLSEEGPTHIMAWSSPHKPIFDEAFGQLKLLFQKEQLKKAVPYVFECSNSSPTVAQRLKSLISVLACAKESAVYLYGFWDDAGGILGATPEMLFRRDRKSTDLIETVACAGTCKTEETEKAIFLKDPKELVEHQLVVKGIFESLRDFGEVSIGEMKAINFTTLSHLLTPITLRAKSAVSFEAMVKALHPTPALGAYPRDEGSKWLRKFQQQIPRYRFGAPAGFAMHGGKEQGCYVAIRGIQWDREHALLGAGCGVVSDSKQDKEWREILLKLKAIKKMLAL